MATSLESNNIEDKMNNEQNANQPLFPIAIKVMSRLKALDERVAKLEQETLNKDQMIELLSNENKKLKEELADCLETIKELRELNDELDDQVNMLKDFNTK